MTQLNIFISVSTVIILLWAINTFIPRDSKIRKLLNVLVILAVIVSLFKVL